jgi:hypothetical protein
MAPLRLWTGNSHELLSQRLQKKEKNVANILESLPPQHGIPGRPPRLVL